MKDWHKSNCNNKYPTNFSFPVHFPFFFLFVAPKSEKALNQRSRKVLKHPDCKGLSLATSNNGKMKKHWKRRNNALMLPDICGHESFHGATFGKNWSICRRVLFLLVVVGIFAQLKKRLFITMFITSKCREVLRQEMILWHKRKMYAML